MESHYKCPDCGFGWTDDDDLDDTHCAKCGFTGSSIFAVEHWAAMGAALVSGNPMLTNYAKMRIAERKENGDD